MIRRKLSVPPVAMRWMNSNQLNVPAVTVIYLKNAVNVINVLYFKTDFC